MQQAQITWGVLTYESGQQVKKVWIVPHGDGHQLVEHFVALRKIRLSQTKEKN